MVNKATVIKIIDENYAEVEVTRQSMCGDNCVSCAGCEKPTTRAKSIAKNTINAKVGDVVNVNSNTRYVLRGAAFVYILPLLLFVIFCSVAENLFAIEFITNISAVIGFVVGIFVVKIYNNKIKDNVSLEIF